MDSTEVEVTPEHFGELTKFMEHLLTVMGMVHLRRVRVLRVPRESVPFYHAAITLLPPTARPEYSTQVGTGSGLTLETALDSAARRVVMVMLARHGLEFAGSPYRLIPRGYYENPFGLGGVHAWVGPGGETDPTLVTTGVYLLELDSHYTRVENEILSLHAAIDDAIIREGHTNDQLSVMTRKMAELKDDLVAAKETADTYIDLREAAVARIAEQREDMTHLRTRISELQQKVDDQEDLLDKKDEEIYRLKAELAESKKQNGNVIYQLTRMGLYLKFKAKTLLKTWKQADAERVCELEEINNLLPPEQKRHILPGDFTIPPVGLRFHRYPPWRTNPQLLRLQRCWRWSAVCVRCSRLRTLGGPGACEIQTPP